MNKTLSINISGVVFNIEEDAYEALKSYLGKIKRHFSSEEGCEEIVADIESRLAEILKAKIHAGKQVLVMADINEAIAMMGQPEDFAETNSSEENKKQETHSQGHAQGYYGSKRRRVFRDPDSKILGGVCSGIGNYFDIDPLWIRLGLVIMFFGFGSGFLLYIILWIIIPEARTTAEKLEMRGEPVDVNTISKTVKDEAENLKNKARDFGNNVRNNVTNKDNTGRFVDLLRQIFGTLINILGRLIGLAFVVIGIAVFTGLVMGLFGFGKFMNLSKGEFIGNVGGADFPVFWAEVGLLMAVGIPFAMLVYKGMKMLLGIKYHNRWLNIGAGVMWVIGLCLSICIGASFANEFSEETTLKQQTEVRWPSSDTLYLRAITNYNKSDSDIDFWGNSRHWIINSQGKNTTWWSKPRVRLIASENDSLYVFIIKEARGAEKSQAAKRAQNINYSLQQNDSVLAIDKYSSFPGADIFRSQQVEVLIKMPKNKVIYFDGSVKNLLYDVDNTNEIYDDEEMVGKYWKMTDNGLTCLNCPPRKRIHPGVYQIDDEDGPAKVRIDEHGIEVHSKDAHVKIDENGVKVDSKEEDEDKDK